MGADVWLQMRLVEACFPRGRWARRRQATPPVPARSPVGGGGLSVRYQAGRTRLTDDAVEASDWMPGTIEGIYGTPSTERIAIKEHLAARHRLHPLVLPDAIPLSAPGLAVRRIEGGVEILDEPGPDLDLRRVASFWSEALGASPGWLGEDLFLGLLHRFVRRVVLEDPEAFRALSGRSALYVGNHQVQIESLLITNVIPALTGRVVTTMANAKHERGWIGRLLRLVFSYPGIRNPENIVYFDPAAPASMMRILESLRPGLASGERSFFPSCPGDQGPELSGSHRSIQQHLRGSGSGARASHRSGAVRRRPPRRARHRQARVSGRLRTAGLLARAADPAR